jgi:hypothetical protein
MAGFFKDYSTPSLPKCTACMADCQTCTTATTCTTCKPGLYLSSTNLTCSSCLASNEVKVGNNCNRCDFTCLTCSGPSSSDCLTCNNLRYMSEDGRCMQRLLVKLNTSEFSHEQTEAVFTFSSRIAPPDGILLKDNCEILLFQNALSPNKSTIVGSDVDLETASNLSILARPTVVDTAIETNRLRIKIHLTSSIKNATLVGFTS